jgi:TRIAD3 protein (E3 ubiquitin-protein ligase RNF216)
MDQPALTAGPKKTAYKNQAKKLLENTFPLISCAAINAVLKSVDFSFADAFYILREIDETTRGKGDGAHEKAIRHLQHHPNNKIKVFLKHPRAKKRFSVREPLLLEEVACIDELNVKERDPPAPAPNDDEDGEKENENEGALVECGCCYGDYPAKDMKQCVANVGHIVCKTCISRYVSEQLDGNNCIQFQCIVDDSCGQIYPTTTVLDEILSPRLKRRTNDAIFRAQVEQAGVEGVW